MDLARLCVTSMQQIVISALVIVTMSAIGLRTSASDFAVVWKRPVAQQALEGQSGRFLQCSRKDTWRLR